MSNWKKVDSILSYYGKGVTPKYVAHSSIIVLNQKCVRNNKIDFSLGQFIDDNKIYSEDKLLKVGDILINSTGQGTAGRIAFVEYLPENYSVIVDSHILVLRTPNYFESRCLNYTLFGIESLLQSFVDGSTGQGEFDKIRLFNILVNFPKDKTTQQKIAAVLSALDDKIELNNKINSELEAMAKTLYDYWFVQFEFPVASRASATARASSTSTTSGTSGPEALEGQEGQEGQETQTKDTESAHNIGYRSSGGKMVYNETLKREIPEGWEVKSLYLIADFINGLACQKFRPISEEDYLPVIKIREMNDGISSNTEKVRSDIPEKYIIEDGDILFSWSATLDVKIWTQGKAGLNQHIFKVVSNEFPRSFYYFELLNYLQHFKMIAELRKTTMGHITIDHLKSSYIAIPSKALIEKLDIKLTPIFNKIILNRKENQELAQLRDWLLPMLMNGQVTVVDSNYQEKEEQFSMAAEDYFDYNDIPSMDFSPSLSMSRNGLLRKAIACHILNLSLDDRKLGNTKFEKLMFLCEYHLFTHKIDTNYYQNVAGPYDGEFATHFWSEVQTEKLYERTIIGSLKGIKRGVNHSETTTIINRLNSSELNQMEAIVKLFAKCNYEFPEIVATLYAAWNDRIINKKLVNDELLKNDFLDWDSNKEKYRNQLDPALHWMRENNLIPSGAGKPMKISSRRKK